MKKKIRVRHYQHTKQFNSEMNRTNCNSLQPVRYHDKKFIAGKYKGFRVNEVPRDYIKWVLENWKGLTLKSITLLSSEIA